MTDTRPTVWVLGDQLRRKAGVLADLRVMREKKISRETVAAEVPMKKSARESSSMSATAVEKMSAFRSSFGCLFSIKLANDACFAGPPTSVRRRAWRRCFITVAAVRFLVDFWSLRPRQKMVFVWDGRRFSGFRVFFVR